MQLTAERQATDTIRASLNYIVDTGVPPVRYVDWPEMEHKEIPPQYQLHEVTIRNGRPLRDTFKLDTHGFAFVDHRTQVKDFTDESERKRVYDPEVAKLIKQYSGASDVLVFDHTIRVGDEQTLVLTGKSAGTTNLIVLDGSDLAAHARSARAAAMSALLLRPAMSTLCGSRAATPFFSMAASSMQAA